MKRKKPIQDHTSDATFPDSIVLKPIGVIHSPYVERFGTPRQATVTSQVLEDRALPGTIELFPGENFEQALKGLQGFDYLWVITWMHLNDGWNPMILPPRGPKEKQGVFATRAPHRPNPIALSALKIERIEGRVIQVLGLDILDGTPVLDVKPYVPYADAFPNAKAGWLDELNEPQDGPDRTDHS